jgi:hypothetical protein
VSVFHIFVIVVFVEEEGRSFAPLMTVSMTDRLCGFGPGGGGGGGGGRCTVWVVLCLCIDFPFEMTVHIDALVYQFLR